ncbi:MAG: sodium transporter [Calditrichaeota bacterium]|nr:MAG: sodium transporter [Calditrichota bacterium]
MTTLDLSIIGIYFLVVLTVGLVYSRYKKETPRSYFLAGRNLSWFIIGLSMFAANISSEHLVGLAGYGASRGFAVGNIEWLAIPFLMLLGWFFAPLFLKTGIFTVPEFLGKRYNNKIRLYLSGISIIAYVLTKISVSLFAVGLILKAVLGWDIYTSALVMMVITGVYTIIGGMRAVMFTSTIQVFFLLAGSIILTLFGLQEVGGISTLHAQLPQDYFTIFKPFSDPDFPWTGILFGAPILAIWYWCTDQYIVQHILCAKNIEAARGGTLLTGFLKILPMFIMVLPGLIAAVIYPGVRGDEAYATLLTGSLLPAGLKGLVLAGVLAALMSSLAASFISTSTLFTMDFYRHFKPDAPDRKLVLVGHLSTIAMVAVGILWIPVVRLLNSHIYLHLQSIQAYISPPIAAVFLLGITWKRAGSKGAFTALIIGGILGTLRLILEWMDKTVHFQSNLIQLYLQINFLHFAVLLFGISVAVVIAVSVLETAPSPHRIREFLIPWDQYSFKTKKIEFTSPAPIGNKKSQLLSIALLLVLIGLWRIFS